MLETTNGPIVTAHVGIPAIPQKVWVQVTYTGGLGGTTADLPQDLIEATTEDAIRLYQENKAGIADANAAGKEQFRGVALKNTAAWKGALKAEHGTGRNMAPFVETEWGPEAYAVMKRLKELCDPDGILNPGVVLNSDPRAHVSNLKPLPAVEEEVDKCIECGYCEPRCPSRDLTLTPRQRIVVRRELGRLGLGPGTKGDNGAGAAHEDVYWITAILLDRGRHVDASHLQRRQIAIETDHLPVFAEIVQHGAGTAPRVQHQRALVEVAGELVEKHPVVRLAIQLILEELMVFPGRQAVGVPGLCVHVLERYHVSVP